MGRGPALCLGTAPFDNLASRWYTGLTFSMPNIRSAEKSLRQTKKRTAWNHTRKDAYRRAIKQTVKAADAGARDDAFKFAREAQKALGKAAKRGVLKKKAAARKLSRLMKRVNKAAK